ncbi:ORF6N domain-containing protein [Romboutsia sp. 1001216sp1]|uniref:ORF6N domain-containing protein n=1 Tax=Romboutsia sp. 1001216sp1 TaxID=2986997 RepID=UPI00232BCA03|nr:ORF6N domain-containing protein [Romboutsia sp. 1001216sp1]MDB8805047.1 ORF6N domain-containing protein [Romboutsia sp. 1001216sp1]MDB8808037.1 ORF6N domain-containing protein [Romboutsia sp. 1001216sp1]MDB8810692.1 ORF6N domain-containing protein [Romboutsia sp. 1001216sp1]MDB8816412.1 ORF6N domain-containing protein [Romboutsia sp. 1001216sp1]MDB8818635.1 ORF6N domain-containing protein [Romboutsia sp. 1001216sp1]
MTSLAVAQTEIEVTGVQKFLGKEIPVIEGGFGKGEKVVLAKTIAEIHGVELGEINRLINDNSDEFEEGIDILNLMDEEFKMGATHLGFINSNRQKYCYLLSEQGYIALVGLMRTDKAKELRKKFRREYFAMRKAIKEESSLGQLSPQLQLLINMELEQKKLRQQINEVNHNALAAKAEIKEIRQVVSLDTTNWRSETRTLIAKIARKQGDLKYIRDFTNESYELLNKRFGVNLDVRLTNKRRRMAEEGVSKSKRDNLNNLDVIAEDKKLIEGYVAIVKDMAIKYGI